MQTIEAQVIIGPDTCELRIPTKNPTTLMDRFWLRRKLAEFQDLTGEGYYDIPSGTIAAIRLAPTAATLETAQYDSLEDLARFLTGATMIRMTGVVVRA